MQISNKVYLRVSGVDLEDVCEYDLLLVCDGPVVTLELDVLFGAEFTCAGTCLLFDELGCPTDADGLVDVGLDDM